ncbi:MAG: 3-deoxy-D-manno-octulosonic acid transferase [Gammaproteobacteria bacterium]|nr:3-deoxy-D-manno-octulosonic acid transferase [Gammaproteobacteria bacterium]
MFFYRILIFIFSPLILGHIIWKAASNKQSRYFWQRLGFRYSELPENCLWFHCASVGEVNTLLPLLKNLHSKNSQLNFIITTNTITGSKIVGQQKLDYLFHSYLPFDWTFSVNRFTSTLNPAALYILETEIWPNLFTSCYDRDITIHIINARLSSKTTNAKPWIKYLLKSALSKVSSISARSEQHARAYKSLGADKNIISTVGNLKFTTALNSYQSTQDNDFSINRDYILVASTHDDEELQIYTLWKKLNREELLIIAPRHPERASSIIKKLDCDNLSIRSKNQPITDTTNVFLLDTVGELKNYFKNAEIVIMGGSFTPVGGHNILEPASYNNAIITGPYMENFKEELELMLNNNAIIQVDSYASLDKELTMLLDDENQRTSLQNNTNELTHNAEAILEGYTALILNQKLIT